MWIVAGGAEKCENLLKAPVTVMWRRASPFIVEQSLCSTFFGMEFGGRISIVVDCFVAYIDSCLLFAWQTLLRDSRKSILLFTREIATDRFLFGGESWRRPKWNGSLFCAHEAFVGIFRECGSMLSTPWVRAAYLVDRISSVKPSSLTGQFFVLGRCTVSLSIKASLEKMFETPVIDLRSL